MKQAPLFADAFALSEWLLRHVDGQTGVLARTLSQDALHVLDAVALALKGWSRPERLADADEHLILLRLHLRLAGATGLLAESQMLFALDCADRIGRQLGGWQRALDTA